MKQPALKLAERGIPVFPCGPDKKPLTKNGFKDATSNLAQVREWWKRSHDFGVSLNDSLDPALPRVLH
jgi:hypothetical protein